MATSKSFKNLQNELRASKDLLGTQLAGSPDYVATSAQLRRAQQHLSEASKEVQQLARLRPGGLGFTL